MAQHTKARLPVEFETRDRVKALKRGGESYDALLRKMADQYDPSEP